MPLVAMPLTVTQEDCFVITARHTECDGKVMYSACLLAGGGSQVLEFRSSRGGGPVHCQVRCQIWWKVREGVGPVRCQIQWKVCWGGGVRIEHYRGTPPPENFGDKKFRQHKNGQKNLDSHDQTGGAGGTPLAVTQEDCLVEHELSDGCNNVTDNREESEFCQLIHLCGADRNCLTTCVTRQNMRVVLNLPFQYI